MANVVVDVQFLLWDGGCAFIGTAPGVVPAHAHQAIQITAGQDDVRFRAGDDGPWKSYRIAAIPSRQPHSMDATSAGAGCTFLIEPETREGRALTERYLRNGIAEVDDPAVRAVFHEAMAAFRARADGKVLEAAARRVVHALTSDVEPSIVSDERILKAIDYIRSHLDTPITLDDVAGQVYLSPGRFRHLFVEQTGMGLRPYILWRRFIHVLQIMMDGGSLSSAAHSAGFADSAHLTRTFKRTMGVAPSLFRVSSEPAARESAGPVLALADPLRSVVQRTSA
jgi:AraC family transcriptional regulator